MLDCFSLSINLVNEHLFGCSVIKRTKNSTALFPNHTNKRPQNVLKFCSWKSTRLSRYRMVMALKRTKYWSENPSTKAHSTVHFVRTQNTLTHLYIYKRQEERERKKIHMRVTFAVLCSCWLNTDNEPLASFDYIKMKNNFSAD